MDLHLFDKVCRLYKNMLPGLSCTALGFSLSHCINWDNLNFFFGNFYRGYQITNLSSISYDLLSKLLK
jgi:hypothetical protein